MAETWLGKKIRQEMFSFISLTLSVLVLIVNHVGNYIPVHSLSAGVMMQSSVISPAYVSFTAGCILLAGVSLFLFLRDDI